MHYAKLIRSTRYNVTLNEPEKEKEKEASPDASEMVKLLRKLSEKADMIPDHLKEENSLLNDYEVNELLEVALEFQQKYFPNIPMKTSLIKPFVWNIPRDVLKGVRYCKNHPDVPDVLNPMFFMYLFLTETPSDAMGAFINILMDQISIDGIREAINDDAMSFFADQMEEPEEDEDEIEEEETDVE